MIPPARRAELRQYAAAYAFDSAGARDGNVVDAHLAFLMRAEGASERAFLFKWFWQFYVRWRRRFVAAQTQRLLREIEEVYG